MDAPQCPKCKGAKMFKKGMLQSGNSKYDVYNCEQCGAEQMKAISVNAKYHR